MENVLTTDTRYSIPEPVLLLAPKIVFLDQIIRPRCVEVLKTQNTSVSIYFRIPMKPILTSVLVIKVCLPLVLVSSIATSSAVAVRNLTGEQLLLSGRSSMYELLPQSIRQLTTMVLGPLLALTQSENSGTRTTQLWLVVLELLDSRFREIIHLLIPFLRKCA